MMDDVAKDGVTLASAGAQVLVGLGGVAAGIALAASDISFGLADQLLGSLGIENPLLTTGIMILSVAAMFALALWVKGMVSSFILKGVFTFLAIMLGVYLVIKVVKIFITLIKTGEVPEGGAA